MKAVKGNKEYSIDAAQQKHYQDSGYDIKNDSGEVIAYGKGKTITYERYKAVLDELNALKAGSAAETDEFSGMSLEELREYAENNHINLGNATSQPGIAKKIREALKAEQ